MKEKICVVGLGYVGLPLAVALAKSVAYAHQEQKMMSEQNKKWFDRFFRDQNFPH